MSRVELDPERGRAVAARLKALGVKGILIKAAEQGYITQLACKMPECFCPEELGGACYFEPVNNDWNDWRSDWMPTLEHFPVSKKAGGKAAVDNAILAHRRNALTENTEGGDIPIVVATVEATGEPVQETEPDAEAATPKPKKTKEG